MSTQQAQPVQQQPEASKPAKSRKKAQPAAAAPTQDPSPAPSSVNVPAAPQEPAPVQESSPVDQVAEAVVKKSRKRGPGKVATEKKNAESRSEPYQTNAEERKKAKVRRFHMQDPRAYLRLDDVWTKRYGLRRTVYQANEQLVTKTNKPDGEPLTAERTVQLEKLVHDRTQDYEMLDNRFREVKEHLDLFLRLVEVRSRANGDKTTAFLDDIIGLIRAGLEQPEETPKRRKTENDQGQAEQSEESVENDAMATE